MDNQNSQNQNNPKEVTDPIVNQPQTIPGQQNSIPATQLGDNQPKKINIALLIILVLTFNVTLSVLSLVISDIIAGAGRGVAETGYGIVFAIFLSPIVIGLILISFLRVRKLKKQGFSVAKTVKLAVIITVILGIIGAGYEFGITIYENHKNAPKHAELQKTIEANKNESITINYATELLNSCKLMNVDNGTNDTDAIGTAVRNSSEGVVLVKANGKPYKMWVTDIAFSTLKPAIDNANKNCLNFRKS